MNALRQKVGPAAQLSPAAMARIAARLEAEAGRPRGQTPMALAGVVVAAALVATVVVLSRPARPLTVGETAAAPQTHVSAPHTIVVPAAAVEPTIRRTRPVAPAPAIVEEETPPAPSPAPVVETPRPAESPLLSESRLLATALGKLHKDPKGALAALDDYATRFPQGQLAQEAQVMRVDALLAVGRRDAALAALDGMTLAGLPRGRELVVLRAELRSEAGRCRDALGDFAVAMAEAADGLDERALYGRAVCRANLGNTEGARADLERYLVRFPDGRFAAHARHTLEK
jgi:TolA-binding protein